MLANEIEVSREHTASEAAVDINASWKSVISAEQADGRRRSKNLGVGGGSEASGWIALVINDRAVFILDENRPAIGSHGGTCENGVNLIGNRLGTSALKENNRSPKNCTDVFHSVGAM